MSAFCPLLRHAFLACAAMAAFMSPAFADYPDHPITIIVPYTPGGSTDLVARALGQRLTAAWGQQIVVDNRPGAGGSVGAELVAKAAGDGYTLLLSTNSPLTTNLFLYKSLGYDTLRDFAPVALVVDSPMVLVVNPKLPAKSLAELIALAKQKPGELSVGTSGNGATTHLATAQMEKMAGVKFNLVPYAGGVPSLTAVMSGEVQAAFSDIVPALPLIKDGRLRVLAVPGLQRSRVAPDVPTLSESGLTGLNVLPWTGLVAPASTPKEIVQKLNREINRILADPQVKAQILAMGQDELADLSNNTPEAFAAFLKSEVSRWQQMVKDAGAKIE